MHNTFIFPLCKVSSGSNTNEIKKPLTLSKRWLLTAIFPNYELFSAAHFSTIMGYNFIKIFNNIRHP